MEKSIVVQGHGSRVTLGGLTLEALVAGTVQVIVPGQIALSRRPGAVDLRPRKPEFRGGLAGARGAAGRGDWDTVGVRYEQRRRSRLNHVQAATDRFSKTAGLPTWLRDVLLPIVAPRAYRHAYAPLREPAFATSTLPSPG